MLLYIFLLLLELYIFCSFCSVVIFLTVQKVVTGKGLKGVGCVVGGGMKLAQRVREREMNPCPFVLNFDNIIFYKLYLLLALSLQIER